MPVLDACQRRKRLPPIGRMRRRFAGGGLAVAMLLASGGAAHAQSPAEAAYERRCLQCHGPAASLAAGELLLRDRVLLGRHSGVPVSELLTRHGRTLADEIPLLVAWLRSLVEAAGQPPKS